MNGLVWYVDRAAGMTALVLLTASVCLGIGLAGRARSRRWPAFAIEDVHRYLGLLTGTLRLPYRTRGGPDALRAAFASVRL